VDRREERHAFSSPYRYNNRSRLATLINNSVRLVASCDRADDVSRDERRLRLRTREEESNYPGSASVRSHKQDVNAFVEEAADLSLALHAGDIPGVASPDEIESCNVVARRPQSDPQ